MMTAYGSIPVAVEAVKLGAFDFITKPFRNEDIFPLLSPDRAQAGGRGEAAAQTARPDPEDIERSDRRPSRTACGRCGG